jgi:hypothetical protein
MSIRFNSSDRTPIGACAAAALRFFDLAAIGFSCSFHIALLSGRYDFQQTPHDRRASSEPGSKGSPVPQRLNRASGPIGGAVDRDRGVNVGVLNNGQVPHGSKVRVMAKTDK